MTSEDSPSQSATTNSTRKKMKTNVEILAEAIASIIFGGIFLILLNTYYEDIDFLTKDFPDMLTVININGIISILTHIMLIPFPNRTLHFSVKVINNIASVAFFFALIFIYPFDTSHTVEILAKIISICSIIGIIIGSIFEIGTFMITRKVHN